MRTSVVALTVFAITSFARTSFAEDEREPSTCARLQAQAEDFDLRGSVIAARDSFFACSRKWCEDTVRLECSDRLWELEQKVPTLALDVHDVRGEELHGYDVLIDGVYANDLAGIEVEPGPHLLTVVLEGYTSGSARIVVQRAEKKRLVPMTLAERAPAPVLTREPAPSPAPKFVDASDVVPLTLVVVGSGMFGVAGVYSLLERESDARNAGIVLAGTGVAIALLGVVFKVAAPKLEPTIRF